MTTLSHGITNADTTPPDNATTTPASSEIEIFPGRLFKVGLRTGQLAQRADSKCLLKSVPVAITCKASCYALESQFMYLVPSGHARESLSRSLFGHKLS